ncbi:replicative DNA helicase [Solibacillus sp. FSL W8-0474]|uniref:replicative DNA helicase n=1 Tax=Solibacillus sp. FSL W8-0474 TaxID=2975336 RepID=UPI0030FB1DD2
MNQAEIYGELASNEAEQSVIGGILLEPEILKDCTLQPQHFYYSRHRELMSIFRKLEQTNVTIDIVAIAETAGAQGLEQIGGLTYLMELAGAIPSVANFKYYQGVVLEYYEKREQFEIARRMMQDTTMKEPGEIRKDAIEALTKLDELQTDDEDDDGHISKVLIRLYDWMEQDHGEITGAPTGFKNLDEMLSGLQRQELVIIGARPSMGKTAFANNILENYTSGDNSQKKRGVGAMFSLEMPDEKIAQRMLSSTGNIDAQAMRNPMGNFNANDWAKTTVAMAKMSNNPLYLYDKPAQDINFIRRKLRYLTRKHPGEHIVAVIDYLQLVVGHPKHAGNRTQEISGISRELKQIARELDCTVIALSQLSRQVEQRQDKRPMMSDLRESGQIEQDADVIGFLYRDEYYNAESEAKGITEVIIAKQRNGPIGTVSLAFAKEYNKFLNLEWGGQK